MENIRPFQIALLAIFAIFAIVSLIVLASFQGYGIEDEMRYGERVVIWGPFDEGTVQSIFTSITENNEAFMVVEYEEKDPRTFEEEFVNAVAEGRGPDLVILPHEELATLRTKLLPVPYDTFSERDFRDRFIDGASIFARPDGIYALPLAVDPIVMYFNRGLLSQNGIPAAPVTWEEIVGSVVPRVTEAAGSRSIETSAIAFGEYDNITYAKETILMLAMQSGSRLIEETDRGYSVVLDDPVSTGMRPPLNAAVQFYTGFSNPGSVLYSWNRAMPEDRTAFLAGDLALYFAYGSDARELAAANPNLDFDVAQVPQGASATVERTYGAFYGIALVRTSANVAGSYAAAQTLIQDTTLAELAERLALVPASRSQIALGTSDALAQVAYDAALIARGWLDPDPEASDDIFAQMIDDIVSNREKVTGAVNDAISRLELAFD